MTPGIGMQFETARADGWLVREKVVLQDGRLVVASLQILPRNMNEVPNGGVTARLLRTVKVREQSRKAFEGLASWQSGRTPRRPKRPQNRRIDEQFYAELARDYVAACRDARVKPTKALASARGVAPERMRSHIHAARANGFLTETTRGLAGGRLTTKAEKVLRTID